LLIDPTQPYNNLPGLPPEQSLESIELYKALVKASTSLAELSATAEHLPNQAALYQSVILLEAKASSEIEQIVTTDGKLFGAETSSGGIDPMTKEVQRYGQAIQAGWGADRPLSPPVMENICSIIKDRQMQIRKVPGTSLKRQSDGRVIYTPPVGEALLRELLHNLFGWLNEDDDLHPIIKSALAHYQFESIHPFTDGNGRTGRILVVLYLVEQRLIKTPVLFLSGEILRDREKYYSLLQSTREDNDFLPYLIWFVELLHRAADQSIIRANKVRDAMQSVKKRIRELDSNMYSQDLVNALFRGPLVFAEHLVELDVAGSVSTAHNYLKKLEEAGLIDRHPDLFNRRVAYINNDFLEALAGEVDLSSS